MTLWGLVVAALGLSGWGVVSAFRMLHPASKPITLLRPLPSVRTIRLTSRTGEEFELWALEAGQPRGIVVACHGYYANRLQVVEIAQGLRQRGYTVILFDLRGHGTRGGRCTLGVEDVEDIGAILSWIRQQPSLRDLPVGLFGLSMGGAIAVQAAARYSACAAVAVDSSYARLFPIVGYVVRRDYHLPAIPWAWITWLGVQLALHTRLSGLDPAVLARRCRTPFLQIHGADDQTVRVQQATMLYANWQGPKEQWIEPQAAHVGAYASNPERYCDRLVNFFDRWLRVTTPSSPS